MRLLHNYSSYQPQAVLVLDVLFTHNTLEPGCRTPLSPLRDLLARSPHNVDCASTRGRKTRLPASITCEGVNSANACSSACFKTCELLSLRQTPGVPRGLVREAETSPAEKCAPPWISQAREPSQRPPQQQQKQQRRSPGFQGTWVFSGPPVDATLRGASATRRVSPRSPNRRAMYRVEKDSHSRRWST